MSKFKRKCKRFFSIYLDDLLILSGVGCLSVGGFVLHTAAGLGVLGTGLIGFGILAARGGGRR